jgi:hypothetical protein
MLTRCFIGYFKLTNGKNVYHQPLCIVDNNVQQSGILLAGLLVEWQQRKFHFCTSDPAVSLIFWCTQCYLNRPTGKSQVVLRQESGLDTLRLSAPYTFSHFAKCDERWFTDTSPRWHGRTDILKTV